MRHVTVENLIDYIESQASDVAKSTLERHMTDCNECEELKQEFQIVIARLREDASFEPLAELIQWGINLFQPVAQSKGASGLRKFIASLVYDTYDQPVTADVPLFDT